MDASQFGKQITTDRVWEFTFKGQTYPFYSDVILTQEAIVFLGAEKKEAKLKRICKIDGELAYEYTYYAGPKWEDRETIVTTCPLEEMVADVPQWMFQNNTCNEMSRACDAEYRKYQILKELWFSKKRRGSGLMMVPETPDNTRYSFMYKGEEYLVGSIVRITDKAQKMIKCDKNEVILNGVIKQNDGLWYYVLQFGEHDTYKGWQSMYSLTPHQPEAFIKEVITPMKIGYIERDTQGINAPSYKEGKPVKVADENPNELLKQNLIYVGVMFGALIFKDWYMVLLIWIIATLVYVFYKSAYEQAHTVYIHDEDVEMRKKINEVLYGVEEDENE